MFVYTSAVYIPGWFQFNSNKSDLVCDPPPLFAVPSVSLDPPHCLSCFPFARRVRHLVEGTEWPSVVWPPSTPHLKYTVMH